ncbi:hypothetical protein OSB04_015017 [Centaurea solstitialis]|uniref:PGG domain-containing protein n=1 Tax=Centaurea solstitialis TaxID=347529 RepID=A0AA38W709_9ASTR|nr:hypothetical protein OSB04_015017 [Centaurea solstitialis]
MEASPSTPPPHLSLPREDLYIHASTANVSNFVSMKLSGHDNYHPWKAQMLCLMETHDMCDLADPRFDRSSSTKIMKQYDSLLKGWIYGSLSQQVLGTVIDLRSANQVWNKLESLYDPNIGFQQDLAQTELEETKGKGISTESKDEEIVSGEKEAKVDECVINVPDSRGNPEPVPPPPPPPADVPRIPGVPPVPRLPGVPPVPQLPGLPPVPRPPGVPPIPRLPRLPQLPRRPGAPAPPPKEMTPKQKEEQLVKRHKALEEDALKGNWSNVQYRLQKHNFPLKEAINYEGNTVLHLAVEKGHYSFVNSLLGCQKKEEVKEALEVRNVDGSTALHIAAIKGKTNIAELLIKKHKELLTISREQEKDNELLTILDDKKQDPLSKAYSSMQFETCAYLFKAIKDKHKSIPPNYMAIGVDLLVNAISAKKYSIALNILKEFPEFARENDQVLMAIARSFPSGLSHEEADRYDLGEFGMGILQLIAQSFLYFILYWCLESEYEGMSRLHRELYMNRTKKKEWGEAKKVLKLVCHEIKTLTSSRTHHHHPYYEGPLLEAACQNAYEVVDEISSKSPLALRCKDIHGHDIIQLAVIHRSDKIYNRVYQIDEGNDQYYKTIKDSLGNNMLHLAGRLAPSHELNRITGAALQLQRELQWREELKKFVFPSYITQENTDKKTPAEVFTKAHEDLVKEGEKWMKTTAESCSITAGLITTIVFAAAITVPGGSNQDKGVPLFTHDIAFVIFAISDAVSLFTSTITLLVFLSILTARFSEQDFLVSLPRRLIIGLCALLVSTTAMMVAFGAILFLVFCRQRPWMLIPICASTCLTVVFFFIIQFPLIVDLYCSTYVPIFGKRSNSQGTDKEMRSIFELIKAKRISSVGLIYTFIHQIGFRRKFLTAGANRRFEFYLEQVGSNKCAGHTFEVPYHLSHISRNPPRIYGNYQAPNSIYQLYLRLSQIYLLIKSF